MNIATESEDARPIPAGAGEPARSQDQVPAGMAYPRGCGGADMRDLFLYGQQGLSPRVRGSPYQPMSLPSPQRPIPAGAGEPARKAVSALPDRAYPRGCGGARRATQSRLTLRGLSPRVRGSPQAPEPGTPRVRPIPAGAGEPTPARASWRCRGAYPRGCGGAALYCQVDANEQGLSPRVRGSRDLAAEGLRLSRPIPAGAGEPRAGQGTGC